MDKFKAVLVALIVLSVLTAYLGILLFIEPRIPPGPILTAKYDKWGRVELGTCITDERFYSDGASSSTGYVEAANATEWSGKGYDVLNSIEDRSAVFDIMCEEDRASMLKNNAKSTRWSWEYGYTAGADGILYYNYYYHYANGTEGFELVKSADMVSVSEKPDGTVMIEYYTPVPDLSGKWAQEANKKLTEYINEGYIIVDVETPWHDTIGGRVYSDIVKMDLTRVTLQKS